MKILSTKDDGEVWSSHEIDSDTALHLKKRLSDTIPDFSGEPPDVPQDGPGSDTAEELLSDLNNALKQTINETFG